MGGFIEPRLYGPIHSKRSFRHDPTNDRPGQRRHSSLWSVHPSRHSARRGLNYFIKLPLGLGVSLWRKRHGKIPVWSSMPDKPPEFDLINLVLFQTRFQRGQEISPSWKSALYNQISSLFTFHRRKWRNLRIRAWPGVVASHPKLGCWLSFARLDGSPRLDHCRFQSRVYYIGKGYLHAIIHRVHGGQENLTLRTATTKNKNKCKSFMVALQELYSNTSSVPMTTHGAEWMIRSQINKLVCLLTCSS